MQAENNNNQSQQITLSCTIEEANLILEGLGLIPFAKVYSLVNKLQQQASQQLNNAEEEDDQANSDELSNAATFEHEDILSKA